ncbi:hypothetical protein [Sporosarcina sp. FSL K6-5500]|uniref:hypothetical protein n=1 Tax=Sporosarcina sp. FSL K6-5500 TaxID=2921558 RepID=UPI0030F9E968
MDKNKNPEEDEKYIIDFGPVNLKSLILTNDVERYEEIKAQSNIGVLFEPTVLGYASLERNANVYLVGITQDKQKEMPLKKNIETKMKLHFSCIAFVSPGTAIITTNDEDFYNRLSESGGEPLCHPDLFGISQLQHEENGSNQFVPFVIQIPKDKLDRIQSVPIDKYAGYETRLYY